MKTGTFLLAFLLLLSAPAWAAGESARILAVVNDDAITQSDLNDRAALLFVSSGLPQDPETRKRIEKRVLQSLIDEHLQLQEARRYSIDVDLTELDKALENVARQNNMSADQLASFLKSRGISRQTLVDQVKAGLSWSRVAQRVLRPQVEVSDEEVNAALERMKANEGKPEYQISEIFLAVDKPSDEDRVQELANTLIERIKKGTPFGAVAQQFSQGIGAINGGDLGWIQPGQLTGELDRAARQLAIGQISLPIRMADGFHILGKREERIVSTADPAATEVHLRQASLPLKGRAPAQSEAEIKKFLASMTSCEKLDRPDAFPEWTQADLGTKKASTLPDWLSRLALRLPVNKPGPIMEKNGYAMVLYVCQRNEGGTNKDAIINAIGLEKLELQAQRLLRDLRRSASIDIRTEAENPDLTISQK